MLYPLRDFLGTSWAVLGRSWAVLGRSWGGLGRSWGGLGAILGGLGAGLGLILGGLSLTFFYKLKKISLSLLSQGYGLKKVSNATLQFLLLLLT